MGYDKLNGGLEISKPYYQSVRLGWIKECILDMDKIMSICID